MDRLAVHKALGDDTRYALYAELVRSAVPLSTSELAQRLDLHPNTVRPHLERMREVGLLEVDSDSRGTVGRPQHRYRPAPGARGVGIDPPAAVSLAGMLAQALADTHPKPGPVVAVGRSEGKRLGAELRRRGLRHRCAEALAEAMGALGFEPVLTVGPGGEATVSFAGCPYRELAEAHPDVVCQLHRGIAEGVAELVGGGVVAEFATLADPRPCRAEVVPAPG
ncbi:MAG TPA: helix-turn-helix domain-containing protein [Acidimicrobiales bacterium]|nr:helix-turn-helix domain-containing protein [Acidimicrobiales bacterium]